MLALKKEGEREENSSLEHTSKIFFFLTGKSLIFHRCSNLTYEI